MIVQREFLNKLKDFGLNTYESKLWTALLSRGISTAGELSDIANVPRSRTYDVLESLERKGFIVMKIGKPIKYVAVPPIEVIDRVKKKIQDDMESQSTVMESLKESEVLKELNLLHTQGVDLVEPTDITGAIKGRDNIYNHMELLIKNAEKSVHIMTTGSGMIRKADALKHSMQKAHANGVKIKILSSASKKLEKQDLSNLDAAEIRLDDDINSRILVVDSRHVVFMLQNDEQTHPAYDVGIWVNTPYFAESIEKMFSSNWNAANPYSAHKRK